MKKNRRRRKTLVKKIKANTQRCALYGEGETNTNCHGC